MGGWRLGGWVEIVEASDGTDYPIDVVASTDSHHFGDIDASQTIVVAYHS